MALDSCHPQFVNAPVKAGWTVQPKQLFVRGGGIVIVPDIQASQGINGARHKIIVVEVKCFDDPDQYQDEIYRAIGQYIVYRNVLCLKQITAPLYLALPVSIHAALFTRPAIPAAVQEASIRLLLVDIEREEITQWLD